MVTALYLQFTGNEETIREWRPHLWFLFSLGIYVAMTNQVNYLLLYEYKLYILLNGSEIDLHQFYRSIH